MKRAFYFMPLIFVAANAFAQEQEIAETAVAVTGNMYEKTLVISSLVVAALLLLVAVILLRAFKVVLQELQNPGKFPVAEPVKKLEYEEWLAAQKGKPSIIEKIMGLRPIEEEKDIMMEHEFDGIAELDNPTPAWFMWLFYASIVFGVAYLLNYHVFKFSPLQDQEYAIEMEQAKVAKEAYLAKAGNLIDETSVQFNQDAAVIDAGKALYATNCVACHGAQGEGTVGPNLVDEYWLHGGTVNDIFKTIKYGIPAKGMISWEKTLTPKQIADVSNYILSLKGSNPPNAKAPQGEKIAE
jgi:cytochrome c oxidase cbb3-type subunit 3